MSPFIIIPQRFSGQDLSGKKLGQRTVVRFAGVKIWPSGNRQRMWLVRCDCGNESIEQQGNITSQRAKSCGCLKPEATRKAKLRHGCTVNRQALPIYESWAGMLTRCTNPRASCYHNYGGRGITVCERWHKFDEFLSDMGPSHREGLTLDRIDTNGNYEPSNCRWATRKEQASNKRTNHKVSFNGETMTLSQWIRRTGITSLPYRLRRGWSVERALTQPVQSHFNSASP